MTILPARLPGMSSAPVWGGDTEEYAAALDVVGYNYLSNRYKMDGILFPNRVIYGSETYAKTIDQNLGESRDIAPCDR